MKKVLIALAMMAVSVHAFAQYDDDEDEVTQVTTSKESTDEMPTLKHKYITNRFWDNWFVQAGANFSSWWCNEEYGLHLDASPLKSFRNNFGGSVAIGKWFSPALGLRTKFFGMWGRRVGLTMGQYVQPSLGWEDGSGYTSLDDYMDKNPDPADREAFFKKQSFNRYFNLHEQALLNINNLFWGYKEDRFYNLIFVGGLGVVHSISNDAWGISYVAALHNQFKINKKFNAYVELGYYWNEHDSDQPEANYADKDFFWNHDNQAYAEIGVTYNIGKSNWDKAPDMEAINALHQSQVDALNAQLADANAENERLKQLLKECQERPITTVKTIKETTTLPASVFFNIGKYVIASKKDLVNVQELANYAKDNNATLIVTGYADSATGSPEFNQTLSENRAKTVADELVNMGVSRDNLLVKGEGGVDTLTPISYNRRVTVKVGDSSDAAAAAEE